tara:strand:- start:730 stop:1197 length:468 start_codon:yes stop_codon:yes gene_type:complete
MAVIEVYDTLSLDGLCYDVISAVTASLEIVHDYDRVLAENPSHTMSRVDHVRSVWWITLQECSQMQQHYKPHSSKTLAPRHRACRTVIGAAMDRLRDYKLPDDAQDEDSSAVVVLVQELCEFIHTLYTALRSDNARKRNKLVKEYASVEVHAIAG